MWIYGFMSCSHGIGQSPLVEILKILSASDKTCASFVLLLLCRVSLMVLIMFGLAVIGSLANVGAVLSMFGWSHWFACCDFSSVPGPALDWGVGLWFRFRCSSCLGGILPFGLLRLVGFIVFC